MSLGVLAILSAVVAGALYGYNEFKAMPRRQSTYAGIKLGATMTEVFYSKGDPPDVLGPPEEIQGISGFRAMIPLTEIPQTKKRDDYLDWGYDEAHSHDGRISVSFNSAHKVIKITCLWASVDPIRRNACPILLGISPGDEEETVLNKLGAPTKERLMGAGAAKEIEYAQFSVKFLLAKGKVYWLEVVDYDAASSPKQ
jgi:hypothetical protein